MKSRIFSSLLALLLLTGCASTPDLSDTTSDGLQRVNDSRFDELYIRSGFDISQYQHINIKPITITYDEKRRTNSLNLRNKDFQFNELELARFQEQINKGLSQGIGIEINDSEKSLIIKTAVTEHYLTASIKNNNIQPTKTFTEESSRMVVTTELIDAESQQVLLRAKGLRKTGLNRGGIHNVSRMNSVTYWQDVYRSFRSFGVAIKSSTES